ncbi:MAG TPA: hypothetical protein VHP56_02870 [Solirubrobacterales bacterium]|jgi:hypothetical protein|nr:hypothetical protein [Solirubrobacterales bacterium]
MLAALRLGQKKERSVQMSKKMMLLVVGALTALAFTALAGTATAKETKLRCEGAGECTFTASGGEAKFSLVGGDTVKCTGMSGIGAVTSLNAERESTTGTAQLLFTGCKEQNSGFQFSCTNTATAGNVTTNTMTVHSIALPGTTNEAGTLVTGLGVTFSCAGGFASTQLTGSLIGESENKCNTNTGTSHKVLFTATSDGLQALTSYTGVTFRLEGKTSHTGGGSYATGAMSGTGTLTFNQNVILTCA